MPYVNKNWTQKQLENFADKIDEVFVRKSDNTNISEISISRAEGNTIEEKEDGLYVSFMSGKSAYEVAVDNGFKGTEEQWLNSLKGVKGDDGYPFLIYKEYDSLSDFDAEDFPEVGLMFMIKEKDENNACPVYRYTGVETDPYSYITGLSNGEGIKGDKGEDGITYQPTIGTVNTVSATKSASASVEVDEETKTAAFSFNIPANEVNKLIIFSAQKPTSVAPGTIVMVYEEEEDSYEEEIECEE